MFFQSGPISRGEHSKQLALIAKKLATNQLKNVITIAGAGTSTSAGISDFRSSDTGLYHQLQKYNLRCADFIFDKDYFLSQPDSLYSILRENFILKTLHPTPTHCFVRLLAAKGLLKRHFTQNIDGLDLKAGIPKEKVIEAHGTLHRSYCLDCGARYDFEWLAAKVDAQNVPNCDKCFGLVRPDIVLFGEPINFDFEFRSFADLPCCDLLIILGTSLSVEPFASIIKDIPETCPKIVVCENPCGEFQHIPVRTSDPHLTESLDSHKESIDSNDFKNIYIVSDCDSFVYEFAEMIGWKSDFEKILKDVELKKSRGDATEFDVGVQTDGLPNQERVFDAGNLANPSQSSRLLSNDCSKFKTSTNPNVSKNKSLDLTRAIYKGKVTNPKPAPKSSTAPKL